MSRKLERKEMNHRYKCTFRPVFFKGQKDEDVDQHNRGILDRPNDEDADKRNHGILDNEQS